MVQQVLYVDYNGGGFEYWFWSSDEGRNYRYRTHDTSVIRRFYKKNGFTKLVLTEEAKEKY